MTTTLIGAGVLGLIVGTGSVVATPHGRATAGAAVKEIAIQSGTSRRRAPQLGDHWGGCNDARAAGTAPIYRGEPGYQDEMDGDDDGVACEPYRG